MHRLYFYAFKFFSGLPRGDEAGMLARAFVPLFILVNLQLPYFCVATVLNSRIELPFNKLAVGIAYVIGWLACTWWFKFSGRGDEIVYQLSKSVSDRRSKVIGGVLVFETLFGIFIPATIAIIRNPTP